MQLANSYLFGQECDEVSYVETLVYTHLDAIAGQSVELLCSTSLTADIMWSYDTDDGYVRYVYWNGHIDKRRLSVKTSGGNFHSLVIGHGQVKDSGLYDCYDEEGLRKVGYRLGIAGTRSRLCSVELLLIGK